VSSRRSRFCALVLLACGQVLLASADDFNLARFVLLPTESESDDLLPLDDPNTDFTQSSETPVPGKSGHGTVASPPPIPPCPSGSSHTLAPPRLCQANSRASLHTPLRC
jgi:hypothetical protein